MRFTIPWEITTTRKTFPHGKSPLFFHSPLWEIPTTFFFINSPMGNSQKKSGKKFFFGIYGQLFPQKWGYPLGRGGMGGIPTPPLWDIWGGVIAYQDCLLRLLVRVLVRVLLVQCAFDFVHSCRQ